MQAWTSLDGEGQEILVRAGTGRVTAVVPVGEPDQPVLVYRVEIAVAAIPGRSRAVRVSAHALVVSDDPLTLIAQDACDTGASIGWEIDWRRHSWVPGHLPVASLNLASDTRATLRALERVTDDARSPLSDSVVLEAPEA